MNEIILRDLKSAFGITVWDHAEVSGGYLNQKWRVRTNQGNLLVKQYSHARFSARKLADIEQALRRQIVLHDMGVPCPRLLTAGNELIRHPDEDTSYMVMEFAEGHVETPETVTSAQMNSLGAACARMHAAFQTLPAESVKGYPLQPDAVTAALISHCKHPLPADAGEEFSQILSSLTGIAASVPTDFIAQFPQAVCHEDFSRDNMLFHMDRLSVFLDFDRNQYSFPAHDIGRILLSLALNEDRLDADKVRSFIRGYNSRLPLTAQETADALRLTLCIEAPWWLHPGCFTGDDSKPRRFAHEMRWLIQNWPHLAELIA